eukprot:14929872-Alexandrium_andersonii.AAC.1
MPSERSMPSERESSPQPGILTSQGAQKREPQSAQGPPVLPSAPIRNPPCRTLFWLGRPSNRG